MNNDKIDKITFIIDDINHLELIQKRLNQKGASVINILYKTDENKQYSFQLNSNMKVVINDIKFFEKNGISSNF